jgi:hypothetical protein
VVAYYFTTKKVSVIVENLTFQSGDEGFKSSHLQPKKSHPRLFRFHYEKTMFVATCPMQLKTTTNFNCIGHFFHWEQCMYILVDQNDCNMDLHIGVFYHVWSKLAFTFHDTWILCGMIPPLSFTTMELSINVCVIEKSISSNVMGLFIPKTKNICIKKSYRYRHGTCMWFSNFFSLGTIYYKMV